MLRSIIISLLVLLASIPIHAATLKVVTSIYPLQLIAQTVLGPQAEVTTLLTADQTPHNFAFKVSDRRRLDEAELVLWVGPGLEPYLSNIVSGHVSLAMSDDLAVGSNSEHLEHHHTADPHLWLSVQEVERFVLELATLVVDRGLAEPSEVKENAEQFIAELTSLKLRYREKRTSKPYAVAHRAYDHFLESFPFPAPIVLSASPEVSPGARSLWRAGESLNHGSCLIIDGGNRQRWLQAFAQRNQLHTINVDLMGNRSGVSTYIELVEGLAEVFKKCSGR